MLVNSVSRSLVLDVASAKSCFVGAWLSVLLAVSAPASAAEHMPAQDAPITFDIPAQPLASALDAYSASTGKEVFYDGAVGAGRKSSAIKGAFTPDKALAILLTGTELAAVPSGSNEYTIVNIPNDASQAAASRIASDKPYGRYFAIIQADVRNILCANPETRPGPHRFTIKFWIGPSGSVRHSELIGTTDDEARDGVLANTLRTVTFEEPPPADMPQPVTMVVFPRAVGDATGCAADNSAGVHR